MELARRYKCHRFEVFSNMNKTGTSPVETMIEFWLPHDTVVDKKKEFAIFDVNSIFYDKEALAM